MKYLGPLRTGQHLIDVHDFLYGKSQSFNEFYSDTHAIIRSILNNTWEVAIDELFFLHELEPRTEIRDGKKHRFSTTADEAFHQLYEEPIRVSMECGHKEGSKRLAAVISELQSYLQTGTTVLNTDGYSNFFGWYLIDDHVVLPHVFLHTKTNKFIWRTHFFGFYAHSGLRFLTRK
jgi:hypothetical protein